MEETSALPTVILLRGDDSFDIQRVVNALGAKVNEDPGIADMNTTHLDGRQSIDEDLRTAATSLPFLAARRLVVLTNPLARLTSQAAQQRFLDLLEKLPESTTLVLVVDDHKTFRGWEKLKPEHWLVKWLLAAGKRARIQDHSLPEPAEMPGWLRKEAARQGGVIQPDAARVLADHLGSNTEMAGQELTKLLAFVNFSRPIETEDVEEVSIPVAQVDVFRMIDALAGGDASTALRMLNQLLEKQDAMEINPLVMRQFRLLVQVREILDAGGGLAQVQQNVEKRDTFARKLIGQAQRFNMQQLIGVMHRLLEMDVAHKTGGMQLDLSLITLIADLAR